MEDGKKYFKLLGMVVASMVVMYGISYLNSAEAGDARWSETRLYMNLMMGAGMAVVMLSFMRGMYKDKRLNFAIYGASVAVFILSLILVRSQVLVHDLAYMRGMIPHHSIAILTSDHAKIRDQRVRELADHIAESQRYEIREMTWLVDDIKKNGLALTREEAEKRKFPESRESSDRISQR